MAKLILNVDEKVVSRAKRYAAKRGTSVSALVQHYLDLLARPPDQEELPPALRRLRGSLRGVELTDHGRHLERKSYERAATTLWAAIERREATGLLPPHGLTTIHDLARKARGGPFAKRVLSDLMAVLEVAQVDDAVIRGAIGPGWTAFEDAVCAAAAEAAGCHAIVTRDPSDFEDSPVMAIDPATALVWIREWSPEGAP